MSKPVNLFVYGTLMNDDIWKSVVTGNYASEKGILYGYARRKLLNRNYPVMICKEGSRILGIIRRDIRSEDLTNLDAFEGENYERIEVVVLNSQQQGVHCQSYLGKHPDKEIILDEDWDYHVFLQSDLKEFIEGYPGWGPRSE